MDNFHRRRLILGRAKVMAAETQRGYLNVCLAKVAEGDYRTHTQIDALPLEFRRLLSWGSRKCHLCVMKEGSDLGRGPLGGCATFVRTAKKSESWGEFPWAVHQPLATLQGHPLEATACGVI